MSTNEEIENVCGICIIAKCVCLMIFWIITLTCWIYYSYNSFIAIDYEMYPINHNANSSFNDSALNFSDTVNNVNWSHVVNSKKKNCKIWIPKHPKWPSLHDELN